MGRMRRRGPVLGSSNVPATTNDAAAEDGRTPAEVKSVTNPCARTRKGDSATKFLVFERFSLVSLVSLVWRSHSGPPLCHRRVHVPEVSGPADGTSERFRVPSSEFR